MQSTRQLHEELAWLSAQLEAARDLEHAARRGTPMRIWRRPRLHSRGAGRKCAASEKGAPGSSRSSAGGLWQRKVGSRTVTCPRILEAHSS